MKRLVSALCAAAVATSALAASTPSFAQDWRTRACGLSAQDCAQMYNIQPRSSGPGFGTDYHGRSFSWHGHRPSYNGYRGYRSWQPGYRAYNGWWFPAIAFAIIAGEAAQQSYYGPREAVPEDVWERHVDWCYNRYRSYRESDNTFQPYHGPREICRSPYF